MLLSGLDRPESFVRFETCSSHKEAPCQALPLPPSVESIHALVEA